MKKQNGQNIEIEIRDGVIGYMDDWGDGFVEEGSKSWELAIENDEEFAEQVEEFYQEMKKSNWPGVKFSVPPTPEGGK